MRSNRYIPVRAPIARTHEGAVATPASLSQQLQRAVLSTLLWEDTFYESGVSIADRIRDLAGKLPASEVVQLAYVARHEHNLRSVPLWLLVAVALAKSYTGTDALFRGVQDTLGRADELGELVALYWKAKGGRAPLPAQMKRGLADSFRKFNAYQLARYDRDGDAVRLLDVMRLVHPHPIELNVGAMSALARNKRGKTVVSARSWEHQLSEGGRIEGVAHDKRQVWEAQLQHRKLGYLALLKNLRNMLEAGVNRELIERALIERRNGADQILPFRYVQAWRAAPGLFQAIDEAFRAAVAEVPPLAGRTAVLIDVSGSMDYALSTGRAQGFRKGQKVEGVALQPMTRMDAACALAVMFPAKEKKVFTFSNHLVEVPAMSSLAMIETWSRSQPNGGTYLHEALRELMSLPYDRLIVISDEQAHGMFARPIGGGYPPGWAPQSRVLPHRPGTRQYMINVAPYQQGVSYGQGWTHIDGFSEAVIRYIGAVEAVEDGAYS